MHDPNDLIKIFNACFATTYQTHLVRGDDEPIYLPKNHHRTYHQVVFAHGFFSSALHECSHWLIAGKARRMQEDYGYWYVPDGRNQSQQRLFEQVEVKPQALEWILSRAAKHRFQFSLDNLDGAPADIDVFQQRVYEQAQSYLLKGLPKRAHILYNALLSHYKSLEIAQPSICDRFGREWIFLEQPYRSVPCLRDQSLISL